MRYYDITLTKPKTGEIVRQWSSHPNGVYNPGALNIDLDILAYNYASPMGASTVRIWGIPLDDLTQAQDFSSLTIQVKGGMKAGLPLANPKQAGTLMIGSVFQSYGNWHGTDMTLDFTVLSSPYTYDHPGNIVLNWKAGQLLSQALQQTLSVAYPGVKINIQISSDLVLPHNEVGYYHTLSQLAQVLYRITQNAKSGPVNITFRHGQLVVYDTTPKVAPIELLFTDMVGQPTWIDPQTMQVKTVLRADLSVGSIINMPQGLQNLPGIVHTLSSSMPSQSKYKSTFQGEFVVIALRHVGDFRSSDGGQWVTIANCVPW